MASSSQGVWFFNQIVKLKTPTSSSSSAPSLALLRHLSSSKYGNNNSSHQQQQQMQDPPEPIPNRPLRGERSLNSSRPPCQQESNTDLFNKHVRTDGRSSSAPQSLNSKFTASDQLKNMNSGQSDQSFLEQFKLGLNRNTEKLPTEQRQQQQQHKVPEPLPPPEDADEIFNKMKETGLIPNAVAMLDGLCKDGLVQEAMKLFGLMREKGTIPEVVIYTAVVDGFCKAHKLDDAKRIFRKMQSNGISPNAFSYTVLIQGLYKCNKLDDAVEFSVEMLEAGHSPNVTTFVGLVDALCRDKGVEEAQRIIRTLRQKGFVVNDKTVREFLDKKAPFSSMAWEAIFGKKTQEKPF